MINLSFLAALNPAALYRIYIELRDLPNWATAPLSINGFPKCTRAGWPSAYPAE